MPTWIWHADSPFLGVRGWQHVDIGGRGLGGRGNDLAA
jgi:hypothetical protein